MIFIGIDPGTQKMGWAVIKLDKQVKLLASGTILTKEDRKKGLFDLFSEDVIGNHIGDILYCTDKYDNLDKKVFIERTFGSNRSCVLVCYTDLLIEYFSKFDKDIISQVTAIEVKKWRKLCCGNGNISKENLVDYICKKFKKNFEENEAEAIGIALGGCNDYLLQKKMGI